MIAMVDKTVKVENFPNICLITGLILHFHTAQCVTFYDFNAA